MANKLKVVDWTEVRKKFPGKPDTWKCSHLCEFLKDYGLSHITQNFQDDSIDGNLLLSMEDDDNLWEDLELQSKDEKLLKLYKNQLKEYDRNFNEYSKTNKNMNEMQYNFQNILKTKEISVEQSVIIVENKQAQKSDEKKKSKKNEQKKSVFEERKKEISSDEDEENDETTIIRKKKPQKNQKPISEDEEDETTIKRKKKEPMINLTQILPKNQILVHIFKASFSINRQKNLAESIYIESKEISRNHVEIFLYPQYGFFLQDMGSGNHTFIKIEDNTSIILEPNMEIVMGESLFKVEKIESNKIKMIVLVNFDEVDEKDKEILEIKFNSSFEDIAFGKLPKEKGKSSLTFAKDAKIENLQAVFKKFKDSFLITALKSTYGTWVKLGDDKVPSDLILLKENMEFKMGMSDFRFRVDKTFTEKIPLCTCKQQPMNSIVMPCKHNYLCFNCIKGVKKCRICNVEIAGVMKLKDIYNQL